jgi:hypothetical protein
MPNGSGRRERCGRHMLPSMSEKASRIDWSDLPKVKALNDLAFIARTEHAIRMRSSYDLGDVDSVEHLDGDNRETD